MNILTVFRSDIPIPATHQAYMHRNQPDLAFPALCGEELCRVCYWRELQRSAIAFDVPESSEADLPRFPLASSSDLITVFDVDALPLAVEASCSTTSLALVPRDLVDISAGFLPARDRYAELSLDEFLVWESAVGQVLVNVEHDVSNEVWGLDVSLCGYSWPSRASIDSSLLRDARLDVATTAGRLLKGGG